MITGEQPILNPGDLPRAVMDIRTLAALALALVACISAGWAHLRLWRLRATVDEDRRGVHRAVQNLRSAVDTIRHVAEALGNRMATQSAAASAELQALLAEMGRFHGQAKDVAEKCETLAGKIRRLEGKVASLADEQGETTVMKRPPQLDASADLPPSTRRDGRTGAEEEEHPASHRTLTGVGPEAERLANAINDAAARARSARAERLPEPDAVSSVSSS